jgi:hypothetical protein
MTVEPRVWVVWCWHTAAGKVEMVLSTLDEREALTQAQAIETNMNTVVICRYDLGSWIQM